MILIEKKKKQTFTKYIFGYFDCSYRNKYDVERGMKETGLSQEKWLKKEFKEKIDADSKVWKQYCLKKGYKNIFVKIKGIKSHIIKEFPSGWICEYQLWAFKENKEKEQWELLELN